MGVLRNLADAARQLTRPQDLAPVDYTMGRGTMSSRWAITGSKGVALGVPDWNSTIYAIVDAQATAQSQIEWRLYRTAASGREEDRVEVPRHPAKTVWENPNPFYTNADLVETLANHYELTGEQWLLPARSTLAPDGAPIELWPVRPDMMRPIPDPVTFISGYAYLGGASPQRLGLGDVIFDWKRHPKDPYRGQSPITAALTDLRADRHAAEYNAEFFLNDATPGGIVKVPGWMNDTQWRELTERWNEQHKGRGNAHRIHVMDNVAGSEYVDLKYTRKDMQFVDLRRYSREDFMIAYRVSDFVLGMLQDVNRATAEAAAVWFGQAHVKPRANRTRRMLNHKLLPMFGPQLGQGYEFDYLDPIPPDRVQAVAEQTSAITNSLALIAQGFDETEVLEYFELPAFTRTAVAAPVPGPPMGDPAAGGPAPVPAARANGHRPPLVRT